MLARAGHPAEVVGGLLRGVARLAQFLAGVFRLVAEALEALLGLLEPQALEDELDCRLDRQVLVYSARPLSG